MSETEYVNNVAATQDHHGNNRAIRVNYDLGAPPEKVWRALTEPKLLERWLFPNDIVPTVGQNFAFYTSPVPGFDGVIQCQVTQAEPSRRLVYSWRSGPIDTVVTWELEPTAGDGTRLSLIQDGFGPEDGDIYELLEKGWADRSAGLLEQLVPSL